MAFARPHCGRKHDSSKAGYSVLEMGISMIFMIIFVTMMTQYVDRQNDKNSALAAAQHIKQFAEAAQDYLDENVSTIEANCTTTAAWERTTAQLKATGNLASTYSTKNAWGQPTRVAYFKDTNGNIFGVVYTLGGLDETDDRDWANTFVPYAASLLGADGGYFPTGDIPSESSTVIQGTSGAWSLDTASYTNTYFDGAGHLAVLIYEGGSADGSASIPDFLYRVSVSGHPEYNEVETDIDMTDHDVNGVNSLQINNIATGSMACAADDDGRLYYNQTWGWYGCKNGTLVSLSDSSNSLLIQDIQIASHNDYVNKASCPTNSGLSLSVFTSVSYAAADSTTEPMGAAQSWVVDAGTQWRVKMRVSTTDGEVNPTSDYGGVTVIQACM